MNKRETLMRRIQMYAFVAHECALYLDAHPDNKSALQKRARAVEEMNAAVAQYEGLYGPLTVDAAGKGDYWSWVTGKWPWQNQED